MHETMVAQSLFEAISAETEKQKAKPISAKISYGTFSCINNEALSFAFEAISKGTTCEGLTLVIEQKPENPARIVTLSPYGCYSYVTGFEWLCGPWIVHLSSSKGISWPFSMTLGERLLNEK